MITTRSRKALPKPLPHEKMFSLRLLCVIAAAIAPTCTHAFHMPGAPLALGARGLAMSIQPASTPAASGKFEPPFLPQCCVSFAVNLWDTPVSIPWAMLLKLASHCKVLSMSLANCRGGRLLSFAPQLFQERWR